MSKDTIVYQHIQPSDIDDAVINGLKMYYADMPRERLIVLIFYDYPIELAAHHTPVGQRPENNSG